jgi:hypothetical protein
VESTQNAGSTITATVSTDMHSCAFGVLRWQKILYRRRSAQPFVPIAIPRGSRPRKFASSLPEHVDDCCPETLPSSSKERIKQALRETHHE